MANRPYIIGIAGPSCSGKSALTKTIVDKLTKSKAGYINIDSYYSDKSDKSEDELRSINFDHPGSIDKNLFFDHLIQLHAGKSINKPIYLYSTHKRSEETETIEPKPLIIVEGLFALYWAEIREFYSKSFYIELSQDICLERRIIRDFKERNLTKNLVLEQYKSTVKPSFERFIEPTRGYADKILMGDDTVTNNIELVFNDIPKYLYSKKSAGRILVVDDEQPILDLLQSVFAISDYEVICAGSAEEALRMLKKTKDIYVFFLDIKLPGMSGIRLFKELKRDIPEGFYFAMTGYISEYDKSNSKEVGFDACFFKPFNIEQLLQSTKDAFEILEWKKANKVRREF